MTGGVGLFFGDFRFDYAYHQFDNAPGIDNHFFSLTYGIAPPKVITDPLVTTPDKVITTETQVKVAGTAVDERIVEVKIKGLKVALSPRGEFTADVSLQLGKNAIVVEGFDRDGKLIAADKLRVLRLITYPDVRRDYWAAEQIGYIGTLDIVKGYPDGGFKPSGNITRAEVSTLLIRTKAGGDDKVKPATLQIFKDVPIKHWAAKYINQAAIDDIVKGYPKQIFKPAANITRAEGVMMVGRFGSVEAIPYNNEFKDVKASHWAAKMIAGAFKESMLLFLKTEPFQPNKKLTRAESVELLYRTRPVRGLINTLLDFEQGY
jgi:hypothetical protein